MAVEDNDKTVQFALMEEGEVIVEGRYVHRLMYMLLKKMVAVDRLDRRE